MWLVIAFRQGPMELDPDMTNSLEQQLGNNLQTGEDSDSEEGDNLPVEWEAVSETVGIYKHVVSRFMVIK